MQWTYRRSMARECFASIALAVALPLLGSICGCGETTPTASEVEGPLTQAPGAALARQSPGTTVARDEFVGSAVCADCHAEISAAYQSHPMAHSLTHVSAGEEWRQIMPPAVFSEGEHLSHRVEFAGGKLIHHELLTDRDGRLLYDDNVTVDFAVGSGRRGRSFLVNRGGIMTMSPLTWYTQGKRWDLSPGYEPGNHQRFGRRVSDGCLFCHSGRVARDNSMRHRYRADPFLEESIGCERCHGPGSAHVRRHAAGGRGEDPIVQPARLDAYRRDAVCNQCHLQGLRRVPRQGRWEFDFRPGMLLGDVWVVFVKGADVSADNSAAAVSQVEQMRASRCYTGSGGELGCISCHDPHRLPDADNRASYYRERCLQCHQETGTGPCIIPIERRLAESDNACVQCHMPRLNAADVPHTTQTDHRIIRFGREGAGPAPQAGADSASTLELLVEPGVEVPAHEQERARGIMLADVCAETGRRELAAAALDWLQPLLENSPSDVDLWSAAGKAYYQQGDTSNARRCWERAARLAPTDEWILRDLAIACHEAGDLQNALRLYDRLLKLNSACADYYGRRAHVLGQLGRLELGVRSAEQALELDPSLWQIHGWLVEAYQQVGNEDSRRQHAEQLLRFRLLYNPDVN